jgi:hypothetical protein
LIEVAASVHFLSTVPWTHRVSSNRFFPFHVCVPGEDRPFGEVIFAHPDVDEDVIIPDDAEWKFLEKAPPGAVLGRPIAHRSDIRPTPSNDAPQLPALQAAAKR